MLDTIFDTLNSKIHVSRETFDRLKIYHELLLRWQSKINLISNDTIDDCWNRHFLDSLQIQKYIENKNTKIADIGTGAGFPGMVIAICGYNNIHLIESDTKKISFLREVSRLTNTEVTLHHERIEDSKLYNVDVILSRACSDLNKLINMSSKIVSRETYFLFHKGKNYSNELEAAKKIWSFDDEIFNSITDPNGVIVKLSNVRRHSP